jgi:hypothetical protein
MKQKKILIASLITGFALLAVFRLSKWILGLYHLSYRNGVKYSVYTVLTCIALATSVQIIFFLFQRASRKQARPATRILAGVGAAAVIAATAFAALSGAFVAVFTHWPEHVVEKDGRMMVARINSFLQVEVYYYGHINAFVRDTRLLLMEDYGNGGYDPYECEEMP